MDLLCDICVGMYCFFTVKAWKYRTPVHSTRLGKLYYNYIKQVFE